MTTYFSGFKIKGLRLKHNLQALEVATALDITPTYLSLIESGKKKPSSKVLKKAAQLFNVTLDDFTESEELINDFEELSKKIDIANIIAVLEMTQKMKG
ncbi:helix-turn-helix transcriptional regulator [Acinetobacter baumannii]|uniref:helix-turn-helix domain-containing protein n=1 Tax=Acinetobacter baumannii TaxID=470 RepID=UPI000445FB44|nr:helix-turn-helix transcriptional regulator [Acinetobacter baumannii]EXR47481.1 helix-turn-helix family protein [Acinetobacter baumannii 1391434]MDC4730923.1 helix-turn-helix domain-containing protein [Acinetobacter baumannii]MDH2585306.1 helix-turn-helix transcriptional regulator [Acinetobacter baumannii]MDI9665310.1 helix-turn-helix transcriptional regulator [Acinetobacter baumannii]MDI9710469.1 helix-turn-helix transcriptional regulator [Acinetobacter baumannii]